MKKNKFQFVYILLVTVLFSACEAIDPMAEEQYRKEIYIVGSYNNVLSFNVPYGDDQDAFISLAISGSMKPEKDVVVKLRHDDEIIGWYNNKFMLDAPIKYQKLDGQYISVPSWSTTIHSGEIYAHLPFTINSSTLHCDSLYAVSFSIESVSDYMISETDTTLILTLNLTNDYSGVYQLEASKIRLAEDAEGKWTEVGLPVPVSIQRTLTAVSADTIRFFHEKQKETLSEYANSWNPGEDYFNAINNYGITFGKVGESNIFTIDPWGAMNIIDGEATLVDGDFSFWYDYMEGNNRYSMRGTMKK